ncbi:hypothetical protein AK830_g5684 [Neonectria ditissima]|uniref:Zn(2)-C6 fungal-type domain-containing protein n=1 Tax=Neonectria ditissima TaxID=78410 RepID=A0A0P7ASP0_9HYPO|nr:hypothetical protein AK830_g5684 [Neonectria ditissima]
MEKRGRNACWKCKERRVKCSLEKPVCGNCARNQHQCQYGMKLLWREEAMARGICFGRQGVHGKSSKTSLRSHSPALNSYRGHFYFFNASADGFLNQHRSLEDAVVGQDQSRPQLALCAPSSFTHEDVPEEDYQGQMTLYQTRISDFATASPDGDPLELHLFDFYITTLCPNLSNSRTENPYLEFIAPLSLTSAPLYHSVLSWSAHELSFRNPGERSYRQISAHHKVRALRGLRQEIESSQSSAASTSSNSLASVLATMIVLSCQEIVEACSSTWIAHLKAARMLCSILWPKGHDVPDSFRRFCIMWFVSHEIMSRTAWIQETLFEPSEWFAGDDETEIDVMIGCSRGLIQQLSETSTLITDMRNQPTCPSNSAAFMARRNRIEAALQRLGQRISTTKGSAPPELSDIAESKRLCALIYLYTCIDSATPSSPVIQTLTARVMRILTKLPPRPSLTFPLFVVGEAISQYYKSGGGGQSRVVG